MIENNEQILDAQVIEANLECGIPTIAVRGKVIFPNVFTTLDVGRIKTLNAIQKALKGDKRISRKGRYSHRRRFRIQDRRGARDQGRYSYRRYGFPQGAD